jgi:hypothetical protein
MSGGFTTGITQEGPWEAQEPYLKRGMARAESAYQGGPAPYFPGKTLAGFDPAQQAAQAATMGYALGPRPAAQQAMAERQMGRTYDWARQMPQAGLTGLQRQANLSTNLRNYGGQGIAANQPTYAAMREGNVDYDTGPFGKMADAYRQQVESQLTGTGGALANIRSGLVNYGQAGGSTRGDILQQEAIVKAVNEGMAMPLAQQYGQAYQQAQGQRLGAAQGELAGRQQQMDAINQAAAMERAGIDQYMGGLQQGAQTGLAGVQQYPGIMAAPLSMYGAMGDIGAQRRAMSQESINQAMQKYEYGATAPQTALQNYMAGISGEYGGQQQARPSALQSAGQLGALMSGLGMVG